MLCWRTQVAKERQVKPTIKVLKVLWFFSCCNTRSTLAEVRPSNWIPLGLTKVKRVPRKFLICKKDKERSLKPPGMVQIPAEWVQPASAFKHIRLDYLGPVFIREKNGGDYQKSMDRHFCMFLTNAVHLDVVTGCSAESALQAVERCIRRRGSTHHLDRQSSSVEIYLEMESTDQVLETSDYSLFKNGYSLAIRFREISFRLRGFCERLVDLVSMSQGNSLENDCYKWEIKDSQCSELGPS